MNHVWLLLIFILICRNERESEEESVEGILHHKRTQENPIYKESARLSKKYFGLMLFFFLAATMKLMFRRGARIFPYVHCQNEFIHPYVCGVDSTFSCRWWWRTCEFLWGIRRILIKQYCANCFIRYFWCCRR